MLQKFVNWKDSLLNIKDIKTLRISLADTRCFLHLNGCNLIFCLKWRNCHLFLMIL